MTDFASRTVQFAWFVNDTSKLKAAELFKALTGEEADTVNQNRVPSPAAPYLSSSKRTQGSTTTTLNVSPGRVDVFVQADQTPDLAHSGLVTINAKETLLQYMNLIQNAAEFDFSGVYRVAVVCNLIDTFDQYGEAKAAFFKRIGMKIIDGDVSDLAFQVNKRFNYDQVGLSINRLFSMNIEHFQQVQVLGGALPMSFLTGGRVVNEAFILSCNIDINNVPINGRQLDRKEMIAAMQRFSEEVITVHETEEIGDMQ